MVRIKAKIHPCAADTANQRRAAPGLLRPAPLNLFYHVFVAYNLVPSLLMADDENQLTATYFSLP